MHISEIRKGGVGMNLKVGDKVAYFYGNYTKVITEVIKVTPTGRIRIKYCPDWQFTKNGMLMGNCTPYRCGIKPLTEELEQEITQDNAIQKAFTLMRDTKKLNYERAVKIIEILEVQND